MYQYIKNVITAVIVNEKYCNSAKTEVRDVLGVNLYFLLAIVSQFNSKCSFSIKTIMYSEILIVISW